MSVGNIISGRSELVKLNDRSPSASTADSHGFQMRTLDNIVSVKLDEIDDRTEEENDCNACRQIDCDIVFALMLIVVIFFLLILVVSFWLKGTL
ncbi:hypothetical protein D917_05864 [Trichinella nativa]|uniref:Uncharacterized protein n=3 Tax=Trichinella TaxID=6333 RepID=A0A1Y3EUU5_9BILA|nr:hypothetical protein T4E_8644 [Trichinella pseudospiralis]OUC48932.1 hypothetical protein D917_05864 [Trichinella nativa]